MEYVQVPDLPIEYCNRSGRIFPATAGYENWLIRASYVHTIICSEYRASSTDHQVIDVFRHIKEVL